MIRNLTNTFCFAITACAYLLAPTVAANQSENPFPNLRSSAVYFIQPFFDIMDCNSEGAIDASEVDDHFYQMFYSRDRDRSRTISQREFTLFTRDMEKSSFIFSQIDKNQDKELTPAEYRSYLVFAINSADADNNGELSLKEADIQTKKIVRVKHFLNHPAKAN